MAAPWGTKSPFQHPNQPEGLEEILLPSPKLLGTGQETPNAGGCDFEAEHPLRFPSFSISPLASLSGHGGRNLAPRQAPEGEGSR